MGKVTFTALGTALTGYSAYQSRDKDSRNKRLLMTLIVLGVGGAWSMS